MILARELGWSAHVLDYATSGEISGDLSYVVGYSAFAFTAQSWRPYAAS